MRTEKWPSATWAICGSPQCQRRFGAQEDSGADRGYGEERRASEYPTEDFGVIAVGHRFGGGEVDRARHLGIEQKADGVDFIGDGDPTPPLSTIAEPPAEAEPEKGQ